MKKQSALTAILKAKSLTLTVAAAVVILFFYIMNREFLSGNSIRSIMNAMSLSGMLAVGISILLIGGEIDLATGAEAMFGGVVCAAALAAGMPIPVAIIAAILFGAVAGLINAFFVNVLNIMSFIVTIGMSSIYTGLAYYLTNAKGINVSGAFLKLGTTALFGIIPTPFIVMAVFLVIYAFILRYTDIGRAVYMIGGNRAAARLTGVNPKRVTTIVFVNNGVIAAIGGVLLTARMHVANPGAAASGALDAIAASVLGGVSFAGGAGGMGGCFIGLLLLNAFINGLMAVNLPTYFQLVAQGALLIIALSVEYFNARGRQKRVAAEARELMKK
ncbi:MAG: ABC transporter permease [Oscillospiraceae bacterium]|jgi:ribose transport system permease protein|nr:ABC transporter permease [Oscillospiraceae bacterium]